MLDMVREVFSLCGSYYDNVTQDEGEAILDNTGEDDEVDPLAFLPDPDQIYGPSQLSGDEEMEQYDVYGSDDSDSDGYKNFLIQINFQHRAKVGMFRVGG